MTRVLPFPIRPTSGISPAEQLWAAVHEKNLEMTDSLLQLRESLAAVQGELEVSLGHITDAAESSGASSDRHESENTLDSAFDHQVNDNNIAPVIAS